MFYLNTIEQSFRFIEQLDQLEVCLPFSRLLTGIPILAVLKNLRWNTNKTSLFDFCISPTESFAERRQIMEVGLTILENRAKNHFKVVISDSCSSQTKQKAVLKIFDGKFIFF